MKTYSCLVVVLMLVNSSVLQAAAPPVKRGVSAATAAKLKQSAEANAAQNLNARATSLQNAAQQTANQLKNERTAFDAALAKQPEFAQFKKELDALVALAKDPNTGKTKAKRDEFRSRAKVFSAKYEPLQLKAYQEAKIDDNKVKATITTAYTQALGQQVTVAKRGALGWNVTLNVPPSAFVPPTLPSVPPYDMEVTITNTTAIVYSTKEADRTKGTFDIWAEAAAAGGGSVAAGVGDHFTIPPGTHQVKVTAAIEASYEAFAATPTGGSWAVTGLMMDVTTADNLQMQPQAIQTAYAVAPIIWIAADAGNGVHTLTKTYTLSGGEVLVLAKGYVQVGGVALGLGVADTSGTVKNVSVEILSSSAQ